MSADAKWWACAGALAATGATMVMASASPATLPPSSNSRMTSLMPALVLPALYLIQMLRQNYRRASEPPVKFSWIPVLGSALELGQNAGEFFEQCEELGDIVKVTLAGVTTYLVTNAKLYSEVFRRATDFSFEEVKDDVGRRCWNIGFDMVHDSMGPIYTKELRQKPSVDVLARRANDALGELLDAEIYRHTVPNKRETASSGDLFEIVSHVMFKATMITFFGNEFATDDQLRAFRDHDEAMPLLMGGFPLRALRTASMGLEKHMELLREVSLQYGASNYIAERYKAFAAHGFDSEQAARMQLTQIWATIANTLPTAFWVIYFIAWDSSLAERVRGEVRRVTSGEQGASISPDQLADMPLLDSVVNEALRLASGSMVIRKIGKDTTIGTEQGEEVSLRAGSDLLICPTQLHFNPEVFEAPRCFIADRFQQKKDEQTGNPTAPVFKLRGKVLHSPLLPFGGGISQCPGQYFAKIEIKLLVARMLLDFDITLPGVTVAGGESPRPEAFSIDAPSFPGFRYDRPGLGIYQPARKVYCEVRPRKAAK